MEYKVEDKSQLSDADKRSLSYLVVEQEKREYYRTYPWEWMEDVLGIKKETIIWSLYEGYEDHEWDGDKDPLKKILECLANSEDAAIEAAVGVGKSYLCAAIVLWFLANWPKTALVYTLAPRKEQLSNIWKHIEVFWPLFKKHFPKAQIMTSDTIRMFGERDERKGTWIAMGTTAQVGAGEEIASRLRGKHSPDMLYIIDETPGVDEAAIKATEKNSSDPHNIILYIGNPTSIGDNLNRRVGMKNIKGLRISALDHPNIVLMVKDFLKEYPEYKDEKFETIVEKIMEIYDVDELTNNMKIRGASSMNSIDKEINNALSLGYEDYNECSDYMINIRGICPIASDDTLISPNFLQLMQEWFDYSHQEYIMTNGNYYTKEIKAEDGFFGNGKVNVYELPKSENMTSKINNYILAADIAGSSSTGDYHGAIIFNRTYKSVAATIQMRGSLHNYLHELYDLCEKFKVYNYFLNDWDYPIFAWETNGVGAGFAGHPKLRNYTPSKLYHRQSIQKVNSKPSSDSLGWWTGANEREEMTKKIREWSKRWKGSIDIVRDYELFDELKNLVWHSGKRRYEAKDGHHDDLGFTALGMALAIDNQLDVNGVYPRDTYKIMPQIDRSSYNPDRRKNAKKQIDFNNMRIPKRL